MTKEPTIAVLAVLLLVSGAAVAQPTANVVGMLVSGVSCSNLTTGQQVISSVSDSSWNCADLGLLASPGDRLQIGARGSQVASESLFVAEDLPVDFNEHVVFTDETVFTSGPVGDLDGDGDLDIVTSDEFSWLENLGGAEPTFVKHSLSDLVLIEPAFFLRLIDADGDGALDIGASVHNTGTTRRQSWFRNDGDTPPTFSEVSVDQVANWTSDDGWGTDVDLDGDIDFFLVREEKIGCGPCGFEIVWSEKQGNTYVAHVIDSVVGGSGNRFAILPLDADGDGDSDLVVADRDADTLVWWENDDGSFDEAHSIADGLGGATRMGPTDIDGDGDTDLVTREFEPFGLDELFFWYENLGDGTFFPHPLDFFEDHSLTELVVGDFSGDGAPDILLTDFPDAIWLENDGDQPPSFTERTLNFTIDPWLPSAADFDSDGRLDLVRAQLGEVVWYENQIGLRLSVGGVGVRGFFCRNRTTGQTARVRTGDTAIDCENEGLTVNPGDEVEVFARGQAE